MWEERTKGTGLDLQDSLLAVICAATLPALSGRSVDQSQKQILQSLNLITLKIASLGVDVNGE
jgi:hypothetical protein